MPLTPFQKEVLTVLAANRSPESHFAGGLVIHASDDSARFSHDFDIFHDVAEAVERCSESDAASLRDRGFTVVPLHSPWEAPSTFRKARVTKSDGEVEIDWAADSAFRFFPIERDALLGWRLHLFDIATNKALALSARSETRDYVDIVELHKTYPLAAIIWAACGKDPGFNPLHLLKMMLRFARIKPETLDKIKARQLDPVQLKQEWIAMSDEADEKITHLADTQPDMPIGVAFVDKTGNPGWIGDDPSLQIHRPGVGGCLPRLHLDE